MLKHEGVHVIGIDPGINGAMAVLRSDNTILDIMDMPKVVSDKKIADWEKKPKPYLDISAIPDMFDRALALLEDEAPVLYAIERVGPSPKMGSTSAFNFGRAMAAVEALAYQFALNKGLVTMIPPSTWKHALGLIRKTKKDSIKRANGLYEYSSHWIKLVKHDGRAEALLLAYYGRTHR